MPIAQIIGYALHRWGTRLETTVERSAAALFGLHLGLDRDRTGDAVAYGCVA